MNFGGFKRKNEKMLVNFYELVDGLVRIYHSVDIYLVVLLTSCLLRSFLVPRISYTFQHVKMKETLLFVF